MPAHISIVRAKAPNGASGWRLRWTERDRYGCPVKCACWFVDEEEACAIRDLMRQGQTFEQALRATISAVESPQASGR